MTREQQELCERLGRKDAEGRYPPTRTFEDQDMQVLYRDAYAAYVQNERMERERQSLRDLESVLPRTIADKFQDFLNENGLYYRGDACFYHQDTRQEVELHE